MKLLIQRVKHARVDVNNQCVGEIQQGLLVYVGFCRGDTAKILTKAVDKLVHLRIFANHEDKLDLSVADIGGQILCVSQFTLYGNCMRGRRPDFIDAMAPKEAQVLYHEFIHQCQKALPNAIETGEFGADMQVTSTNDGPLTFQLEWPSV